MAQLSKNVCDFAASCNMRPGNPATLGLQISRELHDLMRLLT